MRKGDKYRALVSVGAATWLTITLVIPAVSYPPGTTEGVVEVARKTRARARAPTVRGLRLTQLRKSRGYHRLLQSARSVALANLRELAYVICILEPGLRDFEARRLALGSLVFSAHFLCLSRTKENRHTL